MFATACSMDEYAEEKRTEKNLIVRNGRPISVYQWYCMQHLVYLKPKQLIIKNYTGHFVLKLYRHKASCGLFATAEPLVYTVGLHFHHVINILKHDYGHNA